MKKLLIFLLLLSNTCFAQFVASKTVFIGKGFAPVARVSVAAPSALVAWNDNPDCPNYDAVDDYGDPPKTIMMLVDNIFHFILQVTPPWSVMFLPPTISVGVFPDTSSEGVFPETVP